MKLPFNLLREYVTELVNEWNSIQEENHVWVSMKVCEAEGYITVWDAVTPETMGSVGYLTQGVVSMGYHFVHTWNKTEERVELLIF